MNVPQINYLRISALLDILESSMMPYTVVSLELDGEVPLWRIIIPLDRHANMTGFGEAYHLYLEDHSNINLMKSLHDGVYVDKSEQASWSSQIHLYGIPIYLKSLHHTILFMRELRSNNLPNAQ